eukprot:CAMPEP_0178911142 /NCGR_PEP_ID=MMETSP0786-20121207/9514_1 /TAXON_ID=186022 /ORGANISM="Thalassionema frauenfeldii, Strain CCMP 1798" /LENGTH=349 /DNA_ID=CAMNT_0020583523 /DNA_START=77 /DNA_END=1126 /DNA_ORIENTATION=+
MGVTFRSGTYVCFVRLGGRTIKDGEAAVVWDRRGFANQIIGPQRVNLFFSTIRFLDRYKAEPHQYLIVKYRSGKVLHVPGPISQYLNPAIHDSMEVKDGFKLESKDDCIVVFSSKLNRSKEETDESSKEMPFASERRIVCGPTVFFPSEGETIHTFQWTTSRLSDETVNSLLCPQGGSFHILTANKLNIWNCQMAVTTAESSKVDIRLAISYKIGSVEKCLAVGDPVPALDAALLDDVTNCIKSESNLMEWIAKDSTYPTLCQTMASFGLQLTKIQVLGVSYPKKTLPAKSHKDVTSEVNDEIKKMEQFNATKLKFLEKLQDMGVDVTQVLCATNGKTNMIAENLYSKT